MDDTSPKPLVFVWIPFSKEFTDIYEVGTEPDCRDANAYCERVDQQTFLETVQRDSLSKLLRRIQRLWSDRNEHKCFYEVGYVHVLNTIVILLARDLSDICFDLKNYPHIVYGRSITNLKIQLESRIGWYIQNPEDFNLWMSSM